MPKPNVHHSPKYEGKYHTVAVGEPETFKLLRRWDIWCLFRTLSWIRNLLLLNHNIFKAKNTLRKRCTIEYAPYAASDLPLSVSRLTTFFRPSCPPSPLLCESVCTCTRTMSVDQGEKNKIYRSRLKTDGTLVHTHTSASVQFSWHLHRGTIIMPTDDSLSSATEVPSPHLPPAITLPLYPWLDTNPGDALDLPRMPPRAPDLYQFKNGLLTIMPGIGSSVWLPHLTNAEKRIWQSWANSVL